MQQADTSVSKRAHTTASRSPFPVDKTRKPSKTALHPLAPPKIPESMAARAPHPFLHGSGSFSCSCEASSLTAVQISTHAGLFVHSAPLLSPVIRSRPAAEPSKTLFGPIHRLCTAFGLLLMRSPTERQSGRESVKQEASGEHRRRQPRPPRLHRLPCHPTTLMADDRQETGDGRRETGDRRQETGDRRQEMADDKWLTADGKNNPKQLPRILRTNHPADRTAAREIDPKKRGCLLAGRQPRHSNTVLGRFRDYSSRTTTSRSVLSTS